MAADNEITTRDETRTIPTTSRMFTRPETRTVDVANRTGLTRDVDCMYTYDNPDFVSDTITNVTIAIPNTITDIIGEQLTGTASGTGPSSWSNVTWSIRRNNTGADAVLSSQTTPTNNGTSLQTRILLGFPDAAPDDAFSGTVTVRLSVEKGAEGPRTFDRDVSVDVTGGL